MSLLSVASVEMKTPRYLKWFTIGMNFELPMTVGGNLQQLHVVMSWMNERDEGQKGFQFLSIYQENQCEFSCQSVGND